MSWREKSEALKRKLALRTDPVAFKRLERADLDQIEGLKRIDKTHVFCRLPFMARVGKLIVGTILNKLAAKKMGLDIATSLHRFRLRYFRRAIQKNLELEADRAGASLAAAASYSPFGAIDLFKRMQAKFELRRPGKSSPAQEIKDVIVDFPVVYFRSHPPFHVRRSALEREIQIQGWKNRAPKPLKLPYEHRRDCPFSA